MYRTAVRVRVRVQAQVRVRVRAVHISQNGIRNRDSLALFPISTLPLGKIADTILFAVAKINSFNTFNA